jgi:hypothetical protein
MEIILKREIILSSSCVPNILVTPIYWGRSWSIVKWSSGLVFTGIHTSDNYGVQSGVFKSPNWTDPSFREHEIPTHNAPPLTFRLWFLLYISHRSQPTLKDHRTVCMREIDANRVVLRSLLGAIGGSLDQLRVTAISGKRTEPRQLLIAHCFNGNFPRLASRFSHVR